jgi:uncharacterized protein YfdQ (DUF2303 family)
VDTNFKDAFELGRTTEPHIVQTPNGGFAVIVPEKTTKIDIPPLEQPLTRIRQHAQMHDLTSFIDYVNRFKVDGTTQIFAEPGFIAGGTGCIKAVLDYHQPSTPDRLTHIATYAPRYSTPWQVWTGANGTMRQADFAEFIEENRADINEPSAAQLLDLVRMFKASRKVEFDSLTHTSDGSTMLSYSDKVDQQGKSGPMPEIMKLGIPVFFRGQPFLVPVFVRFKLGNGAVAFSLKIDRADVIEDEAFKSLLTTIETATGIKPYLGRV